MAGAGHVSLVLAPRRCPAYTRLPDILDERSVELNTPESDTRETAVETIDWTDFENVDIRVGTVVEAEEFPRARKPLYRLRIDFGPEIGFRWSAAGLPSRYGVEELVGTQVVACLNLGPRNIAGFMSECLTLGVPDEEGETILLSPTRRVPEGGRLF